MLVVFVGQLPIWYEQLGTEEGFEINEYKVRKYIESNYMQNNPEMKSVPPLLCSLAAHRLFQDLSQCRSSCMNTGFHFLTLDSGLLKSLSFSFVIFLPAYKRHFS